MSGYLVTAGALEAEGLPADERALEIGALAEELIERETGGFRFYSHAATFTLNGNGDPYLPLPQPAITITSVTEDGTSLVADEEYFLVNRRPPDYDDRRYPRLYRPARWAVGIQNVVVLGQFGFTELVGAAEAPPKEIVRAAIRLVALEIGRIGNEADETVRKMRQYLQSFSAEGVSFNLSAAAVTPSNGTPPQTGPPVPFTGPTGVPAIDLVLAAYRRRGYRR